MRLAAFVLILQLPLLGLSSQAEGTPLIALKEAENCAGCHKPGRSQRPFLQRRCTLDCQGCHADPSGGGPRSAWGIYYTHDQLNLKKYFTPKDPLEDQSHFDIHYDGRILTRSYAEKQRTFPMSSEFGLRLRPFVNHLHLVYQATYLGRIDDAVFRADRGDDRRFREKYYLLVDALPLNSYAKVFRGQPVYGLRRPNHSLWIRERIGLDQFATTEGVELGTTPNVPFFRASYVLGDPYAPEEDRQKGYTVHGGLRGVSFGWHVNGSLWRTESEKNKINMAALGLGASPWHFLLYGEKNWRSVQAKDVDRATASDFQSQGQRQHPASTIEEITLAFTGIPGVMLGYIYESLDSLGQNSFRNNAFVDFHPVPFVHLEVWRRYEMGSRSLADTLALLHLYFDW